MPFKVWLRYKVKNLPAVSRDHLHALVFSLFPPDVAQELHRQKEKPFCLLGYRLLEGELRLGLGLLKDELLSPLALQYYMGKASLIGEELVSIKPGGFQEEDAISYQALLELEPVKNLSIDFLSPTTFRKGPWDYPLPDPQTLFRSLYRKWQAFSPIAFPLKEEELLSGIYKHLYILAHRIRVEVEELSFGRLRGFVGNVSLGINNAEFSRHVHALLKFGEFAGAGRKTAMGFGVMRLRMEEASVQAQ